MCYAALALGRPGGEGYAPPLVGDCCEPLYLDFVRLLNLARNFANLGATTAWQ